MESLIVNIYNAVTGGDHGKVGWKRGKHRGLEGHGKSDRHVLLYSIARTMESPLKQSTRGITSSLLPVVTNLPEA
jgi:hypothetical protein